MTTRGNPPAGAPCWADLWTSDVPAARRFYCELLGWEALDPNPQFGGYFMFTQAGAPIAGAMGDMGEMRADDRWKVYLASEDAAKAVLVAESEGAQVVVPGMPIVDLGVQAVLVDPTGAPVGVWQPGTFSGSGILDEVGAPAWFELQTRDHDRAVAFYRKVFGWSTSELPGEHALTYTVVRDPSGEGELAGVMDASSLLAEGAPSRWSVYWRVGDVREAVAHARALGAAVVAGPEPSPYGWVAVHRPRIPEDEPAPRLHGCRRPAHLAQGQLQGALRLRCRRADVGLLPAHPGGVVIGRRRLRRRPSRPARRSSAGSVPPAT